MGSGDDEAARIEEGGEGMCDGVGPGNLDSGFGSKDAGSVTGDFGMEGQWGGEDGGGGGGIGGGSEGRGRGRAEGGVEFDVGAFIGLKEGFQGFQMGALEVVGSHWCDERAITTAAAATAASTVPVCEVISLPLKPCEETNKCRIIFGIG